VNTIKIGNVSKEELERFGDVLTEICLLGSKMESKYLSEILKEDLEDEMPNISKVFSFGDDEDALERLCNLISSINHPKMCMILETLIDNCTDKKSKYIDFSPEIKKALELQEGKELLNFSIHGVGNCGGCNHIIDKFSNYCHNCGMKVLKEASDDEQ
jgi:hypothetical protein